MLRSRHSALTGAGCAVIWAEKVSGERRDGRSELQTLLEIARHCCHAANGELVVMRWVCRLAACASYFRRERLVADAAAFAETCGRDRRLSVSLTVLPA